MYTLATLYELRQHLGFAASDTAEDARLLAALEAASTAIERHTRRRFQPRLATILHSIDLRNANELALLDDLLELQAITNGDSSAVELADVTQLRSAVLRLRNGAVFVYSDTPVEAIGVTGIWGLHPDAAQMWQDSGDTVQDAPLSDVATSISVGDADGTGSAPRFQVGHLLRIEAEFVRVLALDTSNNTLTVLRGVQGSTVAEHANGSGIQIFQTMPDVNLLCLRWAAWLYKEADHRLDDLPPVLWDALDGLRRISL